MRNNLSSIIGGLSLAIGVASAGFFISQTMLNERTGANTARVKGLSQRIMPADTAHWTLNYSSFSRDFGNVQTAFDRATQQRTRIQEVLSEAGFVQAEIRMAPLQKRDQWRENKDGEVIDRYYTVSGPIHITTQTPTKVEPTRSKIFALAAEGIDVSESNLNFSFTKLNDIKPDMLREATANARIAANEFAQNAGVSVGGIQSAAQGGFQINPAGSDPLQKNVRVVTNITFYLEN